jgi:hypothetical protein
MMSFRFLEEGANQPKEDKRNTERESRGLPGDDNVIDGRHDYSYEVGINRGRIVRICEKNGSVRKSSSSRRQGSDHKHVQISLLCERFSRVNRALKYSRAAL